MELSKLIKELREKAKLTQKEVGERVHTPQAYISQIESGVRTCSQRMLEDILIKGLGLSYEEAQKAIREWELKKIGLSSKLAEIAETEFTVVPILGGVPCGDPKEDLKRTEETISLPATLIGKGEHVFAIKADGLSMIEEDIKPGDIIICDADAKVEDGDIAVVRLENKVTLKRVYLNGDYVKLRPSNKGFDPIKVKKEKIKIVGKVVYHIKKI